jgi:hypothetical protein
MMATWEEIGEHWNRAQQMGWQTVQAAIEVGEELQQKKLETPHGEYATRVSLLPMGKRQAQRLMRLALHRELIEEHKPESMRGALALLPKRPTKTSDKQLAIHKEEADAYESFAKESAKKQAEVLARKKLRVELERLQNQAHDAVMIELKAVERQLETERKRVGALMEDAETKRQFYQDLLNKRSNGYDFASGLKILRQAVHPDRESASIQVKEKAMDVIKHIEKFLQV